MLLGEHFFSGSIDQLEELFLKMFTVIGSRNTWLSNSVQQRIW